MPGFRVNEFGARRFGVVNDLLEVLDQNSSLLQQSLDLRRHMKHDFSMVFHFPTSLPPEFFEQRVFQPGPVLLPLRPARTFARCRIFVLRIGKNQIQEVQGSFSGRGQVVTAHGTVGDIVQCRSPLLSCHDFLGQCRVCILHEPPEAAAFCFFPAESQFFNRSIQQPEQSSDGLLHFRFMAGRAGIMNRQRRTAGCPSVSRQTDLLQGLPQGDDRDLRKVFFEHPVAGGAGQDDLGLTQTDPFVPERINLFLKSLPPHRPTKQARRSSQGSTQCRPAKDSAQMIIDPANLAG